MSDLFDEISNLKLLRKFCFTSYIRDNLSKSVIVNLEKLLKKNIKLQSLKISFSSNTNNMVNIDWKLIKKLIFK